MRLAALVVVLLIATEAHALPDLVAEVFDIELVRNVRVDPGDVIEGCTEAVEGRQLLRFSLRTRNIGSTDLVLGAPGCPDCGQNPGAACQNPLYICGPAHNHPHFASYVEASLYDERGERVGLARKVGFCVFDLECKDAKFTCENQGLTAGCADVYGSGLPCQYIDLTDSRLPTGDYTLRIEVDPDQVIAESNNDNNTVSANVHITASQLVSGITRRNWVPDAGPDSDGRALGDLWTFVCPAAGTANVSVDTTADRSDGQSNLDPMVFVVDERGTRVAQGDDDIACSSEPICGFRCPEVRQIDCGSGGVFSIEVRGTTSSGCKGGGGYLLNLEVRDSDGAPIADRDLKLGGGARRRVPRWADPTRALLQAPALDDEGVPF